MYILISISANSEQHYNSLFQSLFCFAGRTTTSSQWLEGGGDHNPAPQCRGANLANQQWSPEDGSACNSCNQTGTTLLSIGSHRQGREEEEGKEVLSNGQTIHFYPRLRPGEIVSVSLLQQQFDLEDHIRCTFHCLSRQKDANGNGILLPYKQYIAHWISSVTASDGDYLTSLYAVEKSVFKFCLILLVTKVIYCKSLWFNLKTK